MHRLPASHNKHVGLCWSFLQTFARLGWHLLGWFDQTAHLTWSKLQWSHWQVDTGDMSPAVSETIFDCVGFCDRLMANLPWQSVWLKGHRIVEPDAKPQLPKANMQPLNRRLGIESETYVRSDEKTRSIIRPCLLCQHLSICSMHKRRRELLTSRCLLSWKRSVDGSITNTNWQTESKWCRKSQERLRVQWNILW